MLSFLVINRTDRISFARAFSEHARHLGRDFKIYLTDETPTSAVSQFCKTQGEALNIEFAQIPLVRSDRYVDWLVGFCRSKSIDFVFSTGNQDVLLLNLLSDRLAACGAKTIVHDWTRLVTFLDKATLHVPLIGTSVKVPPALIIGSRENVSHYEEILGDYPYIIKPRLGQGSVECIKCIDRQDLETNLRVGSDYVVEKWIEGKHFTVDVLAQSDGVPITSFVRERAAVVSGRSAVTRSIDSTILAKEAREIATKISLAGPYNYQFIQSKSSGDVFVHDVNPRPASGVLLSIACESPVFDWMIAQAENSDAILDNPTIGTGEMFSYQSYFPKTRYE